MARPRTANVMLPRDVQRVVKPPVRSITTMHRIAILLQPASGWRSVAIPPIRNSGASCAKRARLRRLAMARYRS